MIELALPCARCPMPERRLQLIEGGRVMLKMRLLVAGLVGGLLLAAIGVAQPVPAGRPPVEPAPFAKVLAGTLAEIAVEIRALHRALPMLSPRLEPIEAILVGLRDAVRDSEEVAPKHVQVELLKLDLHLHRLLFDLEQGARQIAEFRDSVKSFVDRFTARMDPRLAQQFREFARELLELVQDRVGERGPGSADPAEVGRIVQRLKVAVNRLDLLLLRSLEGMATEQ